MKTFDVQAERVDLTVESLQHYAAKIAELTTSLQETINGAHPQDALPLLIQIDDALDCMKRRTAKHVDAERADEHWRKVASAKSREN